jgi:hypothetical protein
MRRSAGVLACGPPPARVAILPTSSRSSATKLHAAHPEFPARIRVLRGPICPHRPRPHRCFAGSPGAPYPATRLFAPHRRQHELAQFLAEEGSLRPDGSRAKTLRHGISVGIEGRIIDGLAAGEYQNFVPRDQNQRDALAILGARFMCLSALRRGHFSFRAAETVKLGDTRAWWRHPGIRRRRKASPQCRWQPRA